MPRRRQEADCRWPGRYRGILGYLNPPDSRHPPAGPGHPAGPPVSGAVIRMDHRPVRPVGGEGCRHLLLTRDAFTPPRTRPETLVGARAIVTEPLAPEGQARVGAGHWRAESLRPDEDTPHGTRVIVRAARGLTLLVEGESATDPKDDQRDLPLKSNGAGWSGWSTTHSWTRRNRLIRPM